MSFALITGASKGIGKAIAFELARKGKDVLLVARNEEMLRTVSNEIETTLKVRAAWLAIDLSGKDAPQQVLNWCEENGYVIDVLVNNAGYGLSGPFEKYSLEEHLQMMEVNMSALVKMTFLFLPGLKRQSQSYILNIASSAGYQSTPFLSLYSATKAFVINFSRGLRHELKGSTVSLTCISPGSTDTGFNTRAQLGQKALDLAKKVQMTPEEVGKVAVSAMFKKKTEVIVGVLNKLGAFMVWLLPKKFIENTAKKIYQ
ncbi:MAG: SDR family NAD(P)-dependent oxidoreductase [Flavisolibacter sp.]